MSAGPADFFFETFFLPGGKSFNSLSIEVDSSGFIRSVKDGCKNPSISARKFKFGIPGFSNQHSHCFQIGMAGLTEYLKDGQKEDHFWSWREHLYTLANDLNPDQIHELALRAFQGQLDHGYTRCSEFHYLHLNEKGLPYNNLAETSQQIMAAADKVGIELILIPVFYQTSDFGKPALPDQRRFISKDLNFYIKLVERCKDLAEKYFPKVRVCPGVHSLRAAPPEIVKEILHYDADEIHIHVAEQLKEVEACQLYLGAHPVRWLLDQVGLSQKHHLVHATHVDTSELRELASSGAKVVLCPSTEANLGDGIFPFVEYLSYGGRWGIGSDSQVCLDPFEELRSLDYSQRLIHGRRNPLASPQQHQTSLSLLAGASAMDISLDKDFFSEKVPGHFLGFSEAKSFFGRSLSSEEILAQQIFCTPKPHKPEIYVFGRQHDQKP